jgi:hypothetical protein
LDRRGDAILTDLDRRSLVDTGVQIEHVIQVHYAPGRYGHVLASQNERKPQDASFLSKPLPDRYRKVQR